MSVVQSKGGTIQLKGSTIHLSAGAPTPLMELQESPAYVYKSSMEPADYNGGVETIKDEIIEAYQGQ
jgi:hypothetical protein